MPSIKRVPRIFSGFVKGTPVPQGSMKAFRAGGKGKVVVLHSKGKELNEWRDKIAKTVKDGMSGREPSTEPIDVTIWFYLAKPKSVKRDSPTVKPDIDKLLRAVLDALTEVAYKDDSQVVYVAMHKYYADTPSNVGISLMISEVVK